MDARERVFPPYRHRAWALFYGLLGLVLLMALAFGGWQAWMALQSAQRLPVWAWFLGLGWLPLPWLFHHARTLWQARYRLTAEALVITWGRESHTLPWEALLWAGLLQDYPHALQLPARRLPGLWMGLGQTETGRAVRVLATWTPKPVLVETQRGAWLLAPHRPAAFLQTLRQLVEGEPATPEPAQEASEAPASEVPEPAPAPDAATPLPTQPEHPPSPAASAAPVQDTIPKGEEGPAAEPSPPPEPPPEPERGPEAPAPETPSPWQHLRRDRWAVGLLLGNTVLLLLVGFLWWQGAMQGRWSSTSTSAYVLMVHGWLLGLAFALGFYTYTLPQQRSVTYVLWASELVLNGVLLLWVGMYGLF